MAVDTATPTVRDALLERAGSFDASEPNFARFLRFTTAATEDDDLDRLRPDQLEALWRRSYGRLGHRNAGEHAVYVNTVGDYDVIDVFSADMPFIVDSTLAAIRAHGGTIRFLTHPILPVDPESFRVLEVRTPAGALESFLQIHIDALPDDHSRMSLAAEIDATLIDASRVSAGWKQMLDRLYSAAEALGRNPAGLPEDVVRETVGFLSWLADDNFTFLGVRDYVLVGDGPGTHLEPVEDTGLGILVDPDLRFLRAGSDLVEMTRQHVAFLQEPEPLMVTKANLRSRVHRRAHMDYIGVKLYADDGRVVGELRVLGLFTSKSLSTPHTEVPLIRHKIAEVMRRSGRTPGSHAGKALLDALLNYPRDELFQIGQDQLFEFALLVADLPDRPRVRVLPRIDRFDNFVSVLLYMPRDRYNSDVRARIGDLLSAAYQGRLSAYYPSFPEGDLVRVHFIVGRYGGPTPQPPRDELEQAVTELTLTFGERLAAAVINPATVEPWQQAFSPAYVSRHDIGDAISDIGVFAGLSPRGGLAVQLRTDDAEGRLELRFYHVGAPIPLSTRVPMLENFGFGVIDERTYTLTPADGIDRFIHDMELTVPETLAFDPEEARPRVEAALLAVSRGAAENDAFNQLSLRARLPWFDVAILRALAHYLRQAGLSYSLRYLATVLASHPAVATALVLLFHALHDPGFAADRDRAALAAREAVRRALDATSSLDEDRIIRRFLNLVDATLRTNFYQHEPDGSRRPALAIKFDCAAIDGLPEPRPYREIFVYSPRVEGLHLRFGPIARGVIRWSDRPEDFRTEVLGLVKAQQVKNAVIVPVGAKGGFVPRRLPNGPREAVQAEGVAAYRIFISALLDVTDNLEGETIVPPPNTRRRDVDDPYLVVAADKGTASFSDIANEIALSRGFWLGDAFASGGSVGYDHKKMGITARGAWELVKRHFRELDRDIQTTPVTVVGVGDMSGDVFGNGMLLSPEIRLIAAFDHRDIFIDLDPDPAVSLAERQRLFSLPRSSWQDYDRSKISLGGGVYSRAEKLASISGAARRMLGLPEGTLTPQEVISGILRAEVDLLWFGGIGTYVRASSESDADAGDRANDAVRITGSEIRAKVVGEGANLALTQRGRIEYALAGGRLNTDAIDNSAGVNSSDLEVNIKIALDGVVRAGTLTPENRNLFLPKLTGEVAGLCLRNNYLQGLALSLAERRAHAELPGHLSLIHALEGSGELHRAVEFLPSDAVLGERAAANRGLTRPELAVLLSYAKNSLEQELVQSSAPDDPYLARELFRYFPDLLAETYPAAISGHRLRREIIATVLANAMINRGGPAFVVELKEAGSADAGQIAAAYAAARDVYGLGEVNTLIDGLDGVVSGEVQLDLYAGVQALLRAETLWFLRNASFEQGVEVLVERFSNALNELRAVLPSLLPPLLAERVARRTDELAKAGVHNGLSRRISELQMLGLGSDVVLVAQRSKASIVEAATAFFGIIETFGLARITADGENLSPPDRFDRMALDRALANLVRAERELAVDVLSFGARPVPERLAAWHAGNAAAIDRVSASIASLTEGELTVSRLAVAAGLLSDLVRS